MALRQRLISQDKPVLVLDLDLTAIVCDPKDMDCIDHSFHTLSSNLLTAKAAQFMFQIRIINPPELSDLIQQTLDAGGDILILTSGLWDGGIRDVLADHLDLSEFASQKLRQCYFHSVLTDLEFLKVCCLFKLGSHKRHSIGKVIELRPELRGRPMIALDDAPRHIDSYKRLKYVTAVHATTDTPEKCFMKPQ